MVNLRSIEHASEFFAIQHFFNGVGNDTNITADLLANEYFSNPDSYSFFQTASQLNTIIGTLGNIGFDCWMNGNKINSLMLDRVLISRPYWGKNIFSQLMTASAKRAQSLTGNGFFWGLTPVPKSFIRLGFSSFDCIVTSILPLAGYVFPKSFDSDVCLVDEYDTAVEGYLESQSQHHKDTLFLSYSLAKYQWLISEKVAYRRTIVTFYAENKIEGFCIIRYTNACIAIIDDIHFLHCHHIESILIRIIEKVIGNNCNELRFVANQSNAILQKILTVFKKLGGIVTPYPAQLIAKSFNDYALFPDQFYFTRIWSPPHWLPPKGK